MVFDRVGLWLDPVLRPGPEAMAVDEWLLETRKEPVLRIYAWQGEWGSVGYFGDLEAARVSLPGLSWVRRWTGGGTVDHRRDWTYTLVSPVGSALALAKGAESYRLIHEALADALRDMGEEVRLSQGDDETGAALCFRNPVGHDLVSPGGVKIAGAGQRRTRRGLLHQGSVDLRDGLDRGRLAALLAGRLAGRVSIEEIEVPGDWLAARVAERYADPLWTSGRTRVR